MHLFSLAFLLGVILLQQFTFLPGKIWVWVILFFCLLCRRSHLIIAIMLGFAWTLWFAHHQTRWTLPHEQEGKDLQLIGTIISIPNATQFGTGFLFKTENAVVHLTWKTDKYHLEVGDQWKLLVHLKRIHGVMNPGGFDYEAYALEEGIRANGYVVTKNFSANQLLSSHWYSRPIDRMRQHIKEKIEKNLPLSNTSPWITALVTGERRNISQDNWQVLRNTGTNHLMAIAGLHIGFMSTLAFFLVSWIWRRVARLTLCVPAQIAGAIAALCMALIYSGLAGFSIPTQRACLMLSVFLIISLVRRKVLAWQAWSIALILVLFLNPLVVLGESFWLSFGSVALIIYGVSARLSANGLWWKWGRIQWVIGLGLLPFSVWLFQQFSLVSFIANSIAIPWVGFLVVPLSLLGSLILLFSAKLGTVILICADKLLALLWIILAWLSHLSWASWYQMIPNTWILITACIGIIALLVPSGFPGRWLGIFPLLPLLLYQPSTPKPGEIAFTLLDVGQGLSAVVQTKNHILVFDAGAKLGTNFDMGESVVIPFLRTLGTKKIDMLVISHGDNDHIGGSYAILQQLPVNQIKTSRTDKFNNNANYCLRGENWNWDGVHFEFLYPTQDNLNLGNDSSCVLKVSTAKQSFLLTGDIEKFAEKYLIANEKNNLASTILIAPHHGSKTSGLDEFIHAVNPQIVLFPVGYRNRYHFPNISVLEKYREAGVKDYDTANHGAIQFLPELSLYREKHSHYWNNKA